VINNLGTSMKKSSVEQRWGRYEAGFGVGKHRNRNNSNLASEMFKKLIIWYVYGIQQQLPWNVCSSMRWVPVRRRRRSSSKWQLTAIAVSVSCAAICKEVPTCDVGSYLWSAASVNSMGLCSRSLLDNASVMSVPTKRTISLREGRLGSGIGESKHVGVLLVNTRRIVEVIGQAEDVETFF